MRAVLLLMAFAAALFAAQAGALSFYLMKDGKPLANQQVAIFNKADEPAKHAEYTTDGDGYLYAVLNEGSYQLRVIAVANNAPQAFVRKNFAIEAGKESQLIVALKGDNSVAFEDAEMPEAPAAGLSAAKEVEKAGGVVVLNLVSSEDDKAIANARVFVRGLSVDVKSDKKGNVVIEIPEGEQVLSVIHGDFSSQTIKVTVLSNETVTKFVELTPAAMELEEFVVLAPQVEGSVASLTAEKKNGSAIADIVGSEQMSKKGDSDAAAALKRVSGVTLVDGKNVYVRGLGERYSNVELNSMAIPSPNPYKRIVPLDIFPASIIGSLKVQKTYSADLPGSFAGGYIDLRTKEDVSENYAKLSLALKAHSSALDGTQGDYYEGGSSDFLGLDDGTREIPSTVFNNGKVVVGQRPPRFSPYGTGLSQDDILAMTKEMAKRSIDTRKANVPFGGKAGVEFSRKFEIDSDNSVGVLANYAYDQSHKSISEEFFGYSIDGLGNIADEADTYGTNYRTYSQYKQNGMLNVSYNREDAFKIKYTKLYLLDTVERTRVSDGVIGSNSDLQRLYSLDWEERTLNADQLSGSWKHRLWSGMQLDFGAQWTTASLNQPNNVKYDYIDYTGTGDHYELKTQSAQNLINHNLTTDDDVKGLYLNEMAQIDLFSDKDRIDVGLDVTSKSRESRSTKFFMKAQKATNISYEDAQQNPDFILDKYVTQSSDGYFTTTFLVQPLFSPSDYYDADLVETGFYVKSLLNPIDNFEVALGIRKADVTQTLHEYTIDASSGVVVIEDNEMVVDKLLPTLDLRYKFGEDDQLRFGYSQTYIYPDFREFSSSGYFHPDEAATVIGNPELVHTDITSVDLRFEHYFSTTESWSAALFYKYLDNPIEDVSRPSTSLPVYSFENTDFATLAGFELDGYKKLDVIDEAMEYFYVSGNLSYTKSDVTLSAEQTGQFTTNHRPLQGLSPFVFNASFGYDDAEGRSINLAYNFMSERIRKVGLKNGVQEYPDQYEIPPHVFDFTWQERLSEGLDGKFKVRNLLDGETVWEEGDNITRRYRTGRSFELSLSYKY